MFQDFYGLSGNPFAVAPDPAFLYLTQKHRDALDILEVALGQGAPVTCISGQTGCGKTILTLELVDQLRESHRVGLVDTYPGMTHVMKWVARAFDIDTDGKDERACHGAIRQLAQDERARGRSLLLFLDEAQNLSAEGLDCLRLLTDLNSDDDPSLQLIMLGEAGLGPKLRAPAVRPLIREIAPEAELGPMSLHETRGYIHHRLRVAGAEDDLFDRLACAGVHHFSGGMPGLVNRLCERALIYGFAKGLRGIDLAHIVDVAEEQTKAAIGS